MNDLSMILVELTDDEISLVIKVLEQAKLNPVVPSEKDVDIDDLLYIFDDALQVTKMLREVQAEKESQDA